ncbi:MAG: hypothetical protein H6707_06040 [Deltaproteobacteria bacterium]|nr:hypothetical protein [Deltaproteobacteria bacterium]
MAQLFPRSRDCLQHLPTNRRNHRARTHLIVGLGLLVGLSACTPDFDSVWLVKDLRVLAVQSEPPEVFVDRDASSYPPVQLTALVADPRADKTTVRWQAWACTSDERRCNDDAALRVQFASGESPIGPISVPFTVTRELLDRAIAVDPYKPPEGFPLELPGKYPLGGVAVTIELRFDDDPYQVIATKRVVYGVEDPPGRTPNRNPEVTVAFDGAQVERLAPGESITVVPQPGSNSKEAYEARTITTTGLGVASLSEYLSYSFFTSAGVVSHERTGGKPSPFIDNKKVEDTTIQFQTPSAVGAGTLWVVVRDDRGGVNWQTIPFEVRP